MARIRTVKPEFFTDEDVNAVSFEAAWLWQCIWCESDDATGCFDARPMILKSQAFALRPNITPERVIVLLAELESVGLIELYQDERGRPFGRSPGWGHQRIDKPSKVIRFLTPEQIPGAFREPSRSTPGVVEEPSGSPPGALLVGSGSGSGSGSGTRNEEGRPSAGNPPSPAVVLASPEEEEEDQVGKVWEEYLRVWPKKKAYHLTPKRREKIRARLKDTGLILTLEAICRSRHDPWPDRHLHCDLEIILRSREQAEKFLNLPEPPGEASNQGYMGKRTDDEEEYDR